MTPDSFRRCSECGSWDRECSSETPVPGCGCVRCAAVELRAFRAEKERVAKLRGGGCSICQRPFRFSEEEDAGVCTVCVLAVKGAGQRDCPGGCWGQVQDGYKYCPDCQAGADLLNQTAIKNLKAKLELAEALALSRGVSLDMAEARIVALRADNLSLVNDLEAQGMVNTALRAKVPEMLREHACPLFQRCKYNDRCPPDTRCAERIEAERLCRFPNANSTYPDRMCPKCHEDMNMQGGCRCNNYTNALAREMQCGVCYRVDFRNAPGESCGFVRSLGGDPCPGYFRELAEGCGHPCQPTQACDECTGYWARMRREGYWKDGEGWTTKGQQEYMK